MSISNDIEEVAGYYHRSSEIVHQMFIKIKNAPRLSPVRNKRGASLSAGCLAVMQSSPKMFSILNLST
jgi:hypothetical protein